MRRLVTRLFVIALLAGLGLSTGVLVLAPQASALFRAAHSDDAGVDLDPLAQRSVVYARDGSVLAVLHAEENRAEVALEDIPPHVVRVILAVEDENFYEHKGVNLRATARALVSNVEAGEVLQGGSTVTQQVVKNALLTPEKNLDRKFREAALALRLERELSKEEILERYLNTVYFGNGAYGVLAAAEAYYGKAVEDLTIGESALLAAIIRNPAGYDPIRYPDLARERRDMVIDRLLALGFIDATEVERFKAEPLPSTRIRLLPTPDDYFVEAVKQSLLDDPRLGESPQDRFNAVFKGGLQIHTTLDPAQQAAAKAAVESVLPDTAGEFTAALVAVEPSTGAVRALVGGPGFERAKYNLATQGRRQPGSAFKPFVLAAAMEEGYSPRDTINGVGPCTFRIPPEPWRVENYGNSRGSVTSLESQTARSVNCAYARLVQLVGPEKVVETARKLGVDGPIDPVPALALGTEEVTPLEMAGAYATFANDGIHKEPFFVERVVDATGEELLRGEQEGERALGINSARLVTSTLRKVVSGGTGTSARISGWEVAGKTGTAQDHGNAWFSGYTATLATAVWMGSPVGNVPMRNVGGVRVTGGSYPARIWRTFMAAALADQTPVSFTDPDWSEVRRSTYLRLPNERRVATSTRRRSSSSSRSSSRSTPATTAAPVVTEPVAPPPADGGDTSAGDGDTGGTDDGSGGGGGGGGPGGGSGGNDPGGGGTDADAGAAASPDEGIDDGG